MSADTLVRLTPVDQSHTDAIQRLASDPLVAATTRIPSPYPIDGAQSFIAQSIAARENGTSYDCAILAGETLVGVCGFREIDKENLICEMGYWIGKPFWGKGYATQAVELLVQYGFCELPLNLITAHSLAQNSASVRILEKAGFRFVARAVNTEPKWSPFDFILFYELSREEWRARQ